jgi:hypothetical protein
MSHRSSPLALLLPALLTAACGDEDVAPPDGARNLSLLDAGADATAADRPALPSLDAARPDTPLPPDVSPDFAPSGLPAITVIAPATVANAPSAETMLQVNGYDFTADAIVLLGDQTLTTTRVSSDRLTAPVPAAMLMDPGVYAVQVETGAGDARSRSNILYLTRSPPAPTAPEVVGYNPDNGVAGEVVRIVGSNLAVQPLTITGPGGVTATAGTPERVGWNAALTSNNRDVIPITLPANWQTGPIVVSGAMGSYRGPIFRVGINLTRAAGVARQASSEYPSAVYTSAAATDNNLLSAWYTNTGNCVLAPTCTAGPPSYTLTLPSPQPIAHIAVRGLRDQYRGSWDYLRARFELLDAPDGPPLYVGSFLFPAPERDYDVFFGPAITARIVRMVAEQDQNTGPGLSEIELFAPPGTPPPPLAPDAGAPDAPAPADAPVDSAVDTSSDA